VIIVDIAASDSAQFLLLSQASRLLDLSFFYP